jgi:cell division protein FtsI (penicillin-binding protein 3)
MSKQGTLKFSGRHRLVSFIVLGLFACMAARAAFLQVIDQAFLRKQGDSRMLRTEKIVAHRGILRDRNGQPLAVSTPVTSIWANPKEAINDELDIKKLAAALGLDGAALSASFQKNRQREFFYVKRNLAPEVAAAILAQDFPGVYGMTEYRRYYPEGEVTSQIIGMTNLDDVGQEGLELELNEKLRGEAGSKRVLRDLKGSKIKDVALIKAARPGQDVYLSFDSRVQYLAYRELAQAVEQRGARAGTAVALDVDTGEVLAMVNQPSFNPNNRSDLKPDELRNRAVTDMFEPGSTMKPFTVAAGLESGKYTPRSVIDTRPGTLRVANRIIHDDDSLGIIDLGTVITKSSNVGVAKIALSLPLDTLPRTFSRVGFGAATGSGFPGESRGLLQPPERWRPVEIATMAYGYGVTVTALQLARAYATIASGGIARPVSFLKVDGPVPGTRVFAQSITEQLMPMLESVVTVDGTAVRAAVPGYRVAGKTGTAHKAMNGGYSSDQYMSVFAGMAPASNPKIVLVVVVDSPKGQYFGGLVSAPIFSRIMAETLRLMNVEPDKSAEHLAQQGVLPVLTRAPLKQGAGA